MTLLPRSFTRSAVALMLAGIWATFSIGALVAPAPTHAADAPHFSITLAEPAKDRVTIIRGVAWVCSDTSCVAQKTSRRPASACKRAVRKLGEITAFAVQGEAMSAEELAACNGK